MEEAFLEELDDELEFEALVDELDFSLVLELLGSHRSADKLMGVDLLREMLQSGADDSVADAINSKGIVRLIVQSLSADASATTSHSAHGSGGITKPLPTGKKKRKKALAKMRSLMGAMPSTETQRELKQSAIAALIDLATFFPTETVDRLKRIPDTLDVLFSCLTQVDLVKDIYVIFTELITSDESYAQKIGDRLTLDIPVTLDSEGIVNGLALFNDVLIAHDFFVEKLLADLSERKSASLVSQCQMRALSGVDSSVSVASDSEEALDKRRIKIGCFELLYNMWCAIECAQQQCDESTTTVADTGTVTVTQLGAQMKRAIEQFRAIRSGTERITDESLTTSGAPVKFLPWNWNTLHSECVSFLLDVLNTDSMKVCFDRVEKFKTSVVKVVNSQLESGRAAFAAVGCDDSEQLLVELSAVSNQIECVMDAQTLLHDLTANMYPSKKEDASDLLKGDNGGDELKECGDNLLLTADDSRKVVQTALAWIRPLTDAALYKSLLPLSTVLPDIAALTDACLEAAVQCTVTLHRFLDKFHDDLPTSLQLKAWNVLFENVDIASLWHCCEKNEGWPMAKRKPLEAPKSSGSAEVESTATVRFVEDIAAEKTAVKADSGGDLKPVGISTQKVTTLTRQLLHCVDDLSEVVFAEERKHAASGCELVASKQIDWLCALLRVVRSEDSAVESGTAPMLAADSSEMHHMADCLIQVAMAFVRQLDTANIELCTRLLSAVIGKCKDEDLAVAICAARNLIEYLREDGSQGASKVARSPAAARIKNTLSALLARIDAERLAVETDFVQFTEHNNEFVAEIQESISTLLDAKRIIDDFVSL